MSKHIEIRLIDTEDFDDTPFHTANGLYNAVLQPRLHKYECENILKEAKKTNITRDELIDAIVAEMYENNLYHISIDVDGRNEHYAPAKEMTLSEIEAALGHKVKIINKTE